MPFPPAFPSITGIEKFRLWEENKELLRKRGGMQKTGDQRMECAGFQDPSGYLPSGFCHEWRKWQAATTGGQRVAKMANCHN